MESVHGQLMACDRTGTATAEVPGFYSGVLSKWGDGLVNLATSEKPDGAYVYVGLVLYGLDDETAQAAEAEWKANLERLRP